MSLDEIGSVTLHKPSQDLSDLLRIKKASVEQQSMLMQAHEGCQIS